MIREQATTAYQELRRRVLAVGALHRRCAVMRGVGGLGWGLGAPLLLILVADGLAGLPLAVRVVVVPALLSGLLWWGWRLVLRPLLARYSLARAALLIEAQRPELRSRLISALELYPELEAPRTAFDPGMVAATIVHAQESTRAEDFRQVVDQRPARRHLAAAMVTVVAWLGLLLACPGLLLGAGGRLLSAWSDVREIAQRLSGARLVIEPLAQPAYLRGSDVTLRVTQHGFHTETLTWQWRPEGATAWQTETLPVTASMATWLARNCQTTFECYAQAGRVRSAPVTVTITERPRLVKLSVECELPPYTKRAPIVQPRSDGNLKALYGSSLLLTIEANKPLQTAVLKTSFRAEPEPGSVGGRFAQVALRLDLDRWLKNEQPQVEESYTLRLTDEFGFDNEDAARVYRLLVEKDQGPELAFVGLPHRSSAAEPHLLEKDLAGVALGIRAKDDYGITKVTLYYRLESLETGEVRAEQRKVFPLGLPRTDVPHLGLARLSQLGAQIGDRIVFRAEAEDCFTLGPETAPHVAQTPSYRVAVVSEEQLFKDIVYRDDWAAHWYDGLKVATLGRRAPPPRQAPEAEPAGNRPRQAQEALPLADGLGGSDRLVIQNYFESISGVE